MQNKAVFYKYSLKLMWPAMCRNRSVEILKERPDLVDQMNLSLDQVAYIGDDLPDLTAIESVKLGACPADAATEVKSKANWVSTRAGGDGCVRELCDLLVSHKSS